MKILFSTILLAGVLSAFAVEAAAAGGGTAKTCGDTINLPGNYFLAADCTGDGITITASNVTLKLKGHTMDGTGLLPFPVGISANGVSKVKIIGPGTIQNYVTGILLSSVSDSAVRKVSSLNNKGTGMTLDSSTDTEIEKCVFSENDIGLVLSASSDNKIEGNTANNNDRFGILIVLGSTGNEVEGNTANSNNGVGIRIRIGPTGNEVEENTASLNSVFDLEDDNFNCDDNEWEDNTFDTAGPTTCIH